MPELHVLNMKGEHVSNLELSDSVFNVEPNLFVLHAAVLNYLANKRQGTKSALTRSEVSGGGRKPWRQKGTGRARQGSTRSPQWRHGGVVFAPKPRDYRYSLNKRVKRLAVKSAISSKVKNGDLVVLDIIKTEGFNTKFFVDMLRLIDCKEKTLLVLKEPDRKVIKSTSNIPNVKTVSCNILNVYDIVNACRLVFSKDAVLELQGVYS
jgi:large subunit ribosomal protein L4